MKISVKSKDGSARLLEKIFLNTMRGSENNPKPNHQLSVNIYTI